MAMLRFLLFLLLALGMAAAAAAQTAMPARAGAGAAPAPAGAPASDAYSATVPVAGTSDAQRNAAIAAALAQVLQQVSPGFVAGPDVLAQAPAYVRNFGYSRAASGTGLQLRVEFDPGAVSHLIAANAGGVAAAGSAAPAAGSTAAAVAQAGIGTLWVDGIDNSHAFTGLLAVLRADDALHDVVPVAAEGDGVLLSLGFDRPLATVLADLTGPAGHLTMERQPHPGADASLRWVP
jgi:hypothetical protein